MRAHRLPALFTIGLFSTAAVAQPLYLGAQEIDTADRDAVAAVIERCIELTEETTDLEIVTRFTQARIETDGEIQPNEETSPLLAQSREEGLGDIPISLDVDAVASDGDDSEAEGEGGGEGPEQEQEDDGGDQSEGDGPDMQAITLEDCKEAGLIF
ncbi:hypothetical protein [Pelagibacterium limicola]|uniref:hypothetical protein n=1 Tax=Pelagibacterium limicola TaxID=2791022 RepID=UPI0018B00EFA|nr:hypothetical protein [Pelagibacterium limicola]